MAESPQMFLQTPKDSFMNSFTNGNIGKMGGNQTNGAPSTQKHCFDPDFTENVIRATGPNASPRMREIIGPLIRHVHDFAREVELTMEEFLAGVELVCYYWVEGGTSYRHELTTTIYFSDQRGRTHVKQCS